MVFNDEPSTIEEALKRPDGAQWWNATMEEWQSFIDRGVFKEVDLPYGHRAIDTRAVFKVKRDENNLPIRHKCRIVERGFQAQEGVDFF